MRRTLRDLSKHRICKLDTRDTHSETPQENRVLLEGAGGDRALMLRAVEEAGHPLRKKGDTRSQLQRNQVVGIGVAATRG